MSTNSVSKLIPVNLPAELVAKVEELKQDREEERDQSVEVIVEKLLQNYVDLREKVRWETTHLEEINRTYEQHPQNDWDD